MLWNAIVSLLRSVASAVLGLLPVTEVEALDMGSWSVPTHVVDAVFPWSTVIAAAATMLVWMLVCHGYRIVLWVLGVLHISGEGT